MEWILVMNYPIPDSLIFPWFALSGDIETVISSHTIDQTLASEFTYEVLCQSVAAWLPRRMETMQEESDTSPDILTSEEFANIESEGFTLLTRQLQVKSFKSFPISQT